jgi:hypothetical protein
VTDQPPTDAEQVAATVHDLQTIVRRVREAVATDQPTPATDPELRRQLADAIRALGKAETELAALRAGEEPGGNPRADLTPEQWLWHFNRATPGQRLSAIRRLLDAAARSERCVLMAHEKRLDDDRKAWLIVARIQDVIADMEQITGARHWARILRKVVDGEESAPGPDTTARPAADERRPA